MEKLDKHNVANELRELLNWLAVFEEEYDLEDEVRVKLRERIEKVGEALELLETIEVSDGPCGEWELMAREDEQEEDWMAYRDPYQQELWQYDEYLAGEPRT